MLQPKKNNFPLSCLVLVFSCTEMGYHVKERMFIYQKRHLKITDTLMTLFGVLHIVM